MAFTPISSQNCTLKLATTDVNPRTFALIDGVTGLDGSGGERETLNATAISDSAPRSVVGFPSPEVFEGNVNYDPTDAVHVALKTAKAAGARKLFKLTYSDAAQTSVWRYGYVAAFGMPSIQGNALVQSKLRIALDGAEMAAEPA